MVEGRVRVGRYSVVSFHTHRCLHTLTRPRNFFLVLSLILILKLFGLKIDSFTQFDKLEEKFGVLSDFEGRERFAVEQDVQVTACINSAGAILLQE